MRVPLNQIPKNNKKFRTKVDEIKSIFVAISTSKKMPPRIKKALSMYYKCRITARSSYGYTLERLGDNFAELVESIIQRPYNTVTYDDLEEWEDEIVEHIKCAIVFGLYGRMTPPGFIYKQYMNMDKTEMLAKLDITLQDNTSLGEWLEGLVIK